MTEQFDRQYESEVQLHAPSDAVWRALTDPVEVARWFAPTVTIEPGEGGKVVWDWPDCHEWVQSIEVWEEGRRLQTRYHLGGHPDGPPLFIDFQVSGDGGETTLRVVHSGFGADSSFDEEFQGVSRGWPIELGSLKLYVERHRGTERKHAWALARTELDPNLAWEALTSSGGLAITTLGAAPGEPFAIEIPDAGRLEGELLYCADARGWSGRVANVDDAWLRLTVEEWGASTVVWVWLACYGRPDEEVARYQAAFEALVQRAVASAEETA